MKNSIFKRVLNSKRGEFFVGVGVKILISVVIGAVLLGGTYAVTKDVVMENTDTKVKSLFDYNGGSDSDEESEEEDKITFSIEEVGSFEVKKGSTWGEWISSYGISAGDNGIVWICYDGLGGCCSSYDVGRLCVDIGNGLGCNQIRLNSNYVMHTDVILETCYSLSGPR